jgi:cytochrome c-type biogenesis protein CcmH/NrfG
MLNYAETILAGGPQKTPLPTEFVQVMQQVLKVDEKQPQALWYLGVHAASSNDVVAARSYWGTLLASLDPSSPDHKMIKQKLEELPAATMTE